MRPDDLRTMLRARPFVALRVGLSDGRSIRIRHPDQAIVSDRVLCVGVAGITRSEPLITPESGDVVARDLFWTDLLHVVSVERESEAA